MDYGSVAQWYDAYAQVDVDIPFYLSEINVAQDDVLELACGTGRVSLPLLLWSLGTYDAATHTASGIQTWEIYDATGRMITKHMLEIHFSMPTRADFEALCDAAGLSVQAIYGNFDHSAYDEPTSPFMLFDCLRSAEWPTD